jgi:hypothetical protein
MALALEEKTGKNEKETDVITLIRIIILLSYMTTLNTSLPSYGR